MGYAFSIGGIIVFVSFAVVIVIMMITVSRAVGGAKKNFSLPRISAPAKVVSKRRYKTKGNRTNGSFAECL